MNDFGPIIYAATRKQLLEDGFQVDVTKTAQEAGIRYPVFLNRTVWDKYVAVPPGVECQDEAERLWDVIWMTRFAISKTKGAIANVELYVRNNNRQAKLVKLKAVCGATDIDNPAPSITIMLPEED